MPCVSRRYQYRLLLQTTEEHTIWPGALNRGEHDARQTIVGGELFSPQHAKCAATLAKCASVLCQNCVTYPQKPGQTSPVTGICRCTSMLREGVDRKCVGGCCCALLRVK